MKKIARILLLCGIAMVLLSGTAMAFGIGIRVISEPVVMFLFGSGMIGLASVGRKKFIEDPRADRAEH